MLPYLIDDRAIIISGSIALTNGTTLALSGANVIDYRISEASTGGSELTVGDTRAASARMTIADEAHALSAAQLLGARVEIYTALEGQQTPDPVGTWFIDDCDISRQSASISISGSDALATKFEGKWTDGTYPTTLGALFARVAALAGVETAQEEFRFSDTTIDQTPPWPDGVTVRDVLGYIAQCAGGFARMDRTGRLEIVEYAPTVAAVETVTASDFTRLRLGKGARFTFNALLVMEMEATEYTRYALDEDLPDAATNSIRIARNPLMTPTLAADLRDALEGLEAQAVRMEWVGDPSVTTGDLIAVEDTDGTEYDVLVTEHELSLTGGMSAVTACELPSALESGWRSGAVLTPDGKLSPGAIADGTIEYIKISAGARQALVLEAGKAVKIGGTNLLKGTRQGFENWEFWVSQNSATYWDRTVTGLGSCRRYTATGAMDNFIVWTYVSYVPLQAGVEYTINTKIANYGKACAYRMQTSEDGATWTNEGRWYGELPAYADGFHDFVFTWTPPATRYYRVGVIVPSFSGYIDLFDTWKLEAGNKATAWSPCPEEFTAGSTVTITEARVDISTPLFNVNTYSDEGYIRVSASGVETGHLSALNVADRYDGPATITVNASAASDGLNTFRTLTDALAALSGKWLDFDVTVSVETNTTENIMTLTGVYGRGSVTVNGGGKTANGRIVLSNCASVFINNLSVACPGEVSVVQALRVQSLVLSGCVIVSDYVRGTSNPPPPGAKGLEVFNGSARITSCTLTAVRLGVVATIGGNIYVQNCSGSCGVYGLVANADGKIGIAASGTIPSGGSGSTYTQDGGQIIGAGSSQGGTTPVTPTTTTTATFSVSVSKTRSGASGWLKGTPTMQSGLLGSASNNNVGAMWFDLSSLAGKTVQSASITLTRLKRFADGTYVDGSSGAIILYAETATVSASGARGSAGLGTVANQSEIGRWSPGANVTTALPPAAVQAIIDGTARALVVYSTDSALVSGKSYSANYGAFAGAGQIGAPVLSVTYT